MFLCAAPGLLVELRSTLESLGHAPTCASPVDYLVRKNDDGSVSCFVGAIDLPSHTRWSVEINLPKDKACFTTRSFWDNPTCQGAVILPLDEFGRKNGRRS